MIVKPSLIFIFSLFLTNIKGKIPAIAVMKPLSNRGENDESKSYTIETIILKNIKNALNINANPIFLETILRFIYSPFYNNLCKEL